MRRHAWPLAIVFAFLLAWAVAYKMSVAQPTAARVEQIEREEVLKYHTLAVQAQGMRDRFIEYLARKHGVDLKTHHYAIDSGEFVPRPAEKK